MMSAHGHVNGRERPQVTPAAVIGDRRGGLGIDPHRLAGSFWLGSPAPVVIKFRRLVVM
jgi:hypothetical protein